MRVLLFNVNCFNYAIARALPSLLEAAGDPDVLLLNEVPLGVGRALERSLGAEWSGWRAASKRFVYLVPFQLAIYARAPLRFERLGQAPLGGGCSVLYGYLTGAGEPLLVALAHLSAEWPVGFGRWHGARRAREIERLVEALAPRARERNEILLAGDFNFARAGGREEEHCQAGDRLAAGLGVVDAAEAAGVSEAPATWPSPGTPSLGLPPQRFDLAYVTKSILERRIRFEVPPWPLAFSGSDHLPLILELGLPGGDAPRKLTRIASARGSSDIAADRPSREAPRRERT